MWNHQTPYGEEFIRFTLVDNKKNEIIHEIVAKEMITKCKLVFGFCRDP